MSKNALTLCIMWLRHDRIIGNCCLFSPSRGDRSIWYARPLWAYETLKAIRQRTGLTRCAMQFKFHGCHSQGVQHRDLSESLSGDSIVNLAVSVTHSCRVSAYMHKQRCYGWLKYYSLFMRRMNSFDATNAIAMSKRNIECQRLRLGGVVVWIRK